jgi:hypothetical protein
MALRMRGRLAVIILTSWLVSPEFARQVRGVCGTNPDLRKQELFLHRKAVRASRRSEYGDFRRGAFQTFQVRLYRGGLAPNYDSGLYQVIVMLPQNVRTGTQQLAVTIDGIASNTVQVAIQ